MADRFFPDKHIENAPVARPVSRRVLAWLGIVVVAGGLLASGFIISARQHFEAISLGYQSEELRRQSTQLDEKLRQLELEYARAASPVEIEKRAEKIGLERPDKKTPDKKTPENPPVRTGPKKTRTVSCCAEATRGFGGAEALIHHVPRAVLAVRYQPTSRQVKSGTEPLQ